MDNNSPARKKSVSLYPTDEKIIFQLANSRGLDFSSALRMIVREWDERQQQISATVDRVLQGN